MSNCTVTFYKDKDYSGKNRTFTEAQKVSDLNDVNWDDDSNRDDMKDDASSIETGSQAWIRVFSKENYQGRTVLIGPNSSYNLKDLKDDNNEDDMDDTIASFQLYDHEPAVNTTNITNNFIALYPNGVHTKKDDLYNSEVYAQDSSFRVYDPIIILDGSKVAFTINLDHIQGEQDDHATVTFAMDFNGNFTDQIQVTYEIQEATQVPDWLIKIIDGAIDVAADAAKLLADGAEIILTDGVGVVATVDTNKLIDYTAKAISFCVDHINTVLSAVFTLQDDGGTMYFPAMVSHSIARLVLAYYQELYVENETLTFDGTKFLNSLGGSSWNNSKHNAYVEFSVNGYPYRSYYPDSSFYDNQFGMLSSVKIDAVTDNEKDDHLIMQSTYDLNGNLFSVVGSIDLFSRDHDDDYEAPTSGVLTYNDQGEMMHITKDGKITKVLCDSLEEAYEKKMIMALRYTAKKYDIELTQQQIGLVTASSSVLAATEAGI
ncbi:hypothetical protein [uncultured Kordia sp.]|uniref:hypothetical protein n=1 Tax=uncultured Kordia sp. TaxID=507699 RepID=UPI0026072E66|nr:hypothetical protein [uncultured Kordia sp.]